MRGSYFLLILVLSGWITTGASCSSETSRQTDGVTLSFDDEQLVGGWTEQSLDWEVGLQDFELLRRRLTEDEPGIEVGPLLRVETQVVAGFNVRLTARYRKGDQSGVVQAVVYHTIDGSRSLNQYLFLSELP